MEFGDSRGGAGRVRPVGGRLLRWLRWAPFQLLLPALLALYEAGAARWARA